MEVTCILTSGTSAASWSATYLGFSIASAKKLTVSNTLTFTGTDSSSVAFGAGGTVAYTNVTTLSSLVSVGTITTGGLGSGATLGAVTMSLGSDANGDMYYRASNVLTRLPKGTALQQLRMNAGATAPEWFTSSGGAASCVTIMPPPNYVSTALGTITYSSNTTGYTSQFYLPFAITVNKISFVVDATPVDGTIKIGIYSEDGQTKEIDVTSGTLSATGVLYTVAVAGIALTAGVHYLVIVPVSTAQITVYCYNRGTGIDLFNVVTSEPKLFGTQVVTAGTLPTTFTPSSITASDSGLLAYFRLDN